MIRIIPFIAFCIALTSAFHVKADVVYAQSAFGDPIEQRVDTSKTGGLVAVEQDIEGGEIPVGSTAQVIVRFRNESPRPIEFRDINLYPSSTISAETTVNQCATEPLDSAAECAIVLAIKGLQPGTWRTEMLIRHTGKSRLVTARITGSVTTSDGGANLVTDIEVLPSPVDFGTLTASRPIIQSLTIRNITSKDITIKDLYIDAPSQSGYDLRSDCKTLRAGQACIASILWSPIIEGPSSGFLVLEHDGPSAVTSVPMTGEFSPGTAEAAEVFPNSTPGRGVLVSSETEIDFGSAIESQSAITLSLVNVGDTDLSLYDINLAGSDNGLKLLQNGCRAEMILSPTEACPLTVSWTPSKTGAVIDDIQIRHDGARGILVLPVRGTATAAVSVDAKPINIATFSESDGTSLTTVADGQSLEADADEPPVLDGHVVTSHSTNHAIIRGPTGSRIVTDGKKTILGGAEWVVDVVDEGVKLSSGANVVLLVFDRSLTRSSSSTGDAEE